MAIINICIIHSSENKMVVGGSGRFYTVESI